MKRSAAPRRAVWYTVIRGIYLQELDEFVEQELIPHTRGEQAGKANLNTKG